MFHHVPCRIGILLGVLLLIPPPAYSQDTKQIRENYMLRLKNGLREKEKTLSRSAEEAVSKLISDGVEKLAGDGLQREKLRQAERNLDRLVTELVKLSANSGTVDEEAIKTAKQTLCPIYPWC